MPQIDISEESGVTSTTELADNTYYATALALTAEAQTRAIRVGIHDAKILPADNNSLIWTTSLLSCFPVILIFANKDIGLLHASNASLDKIIDMLNSDKLLEIQIITKAAAGTNVGKAKAFTQNLFKHFKDKTNMPVIKIEIQDDSPPYSAALCYKSPVNGKPIILVGQSSDRKMAENMDECINKEDQVVPYNLKTIIAPLDTIIEQQNIKAALALLKNQSIEKEDIENSTSCTSCKLF